MSRVGDAFRLCFGTLTILPVRPPDVMDRRVGGWAMTLAPLAALVLAVPSLALVKVLHWDQPQSPIFYWAGPGPVQPPTPPDRLPALLVAVLLVALTAILTRGMHLDGLADTADGLGSGKPAEQALAVMRKSDIGPFGVVTLVLTLLIQVAALQQLLVRGLGLPAVVIALVVSRLILPLACSRGVPPARPEGLGAVVAGTVGRVQLLLSALIAAGCLLAGLLVAVTLNPVHSPSGSYVLIEHTSQPVLLQVALVVTPLLVGALLLWRCVRRFGGITGDVLGACVEVTYTASVVLLCFL